MFVRWFRCRWRHGHMRLTNRSRFINEAIRELARGRTRAQLRMLLEEDGRVNRDRDLQLVEEWTAASTEGWRAPRRG